VTSTSRLPRAGQVYAWVVITLGVLAIGQSLHQLYRAPLEPQWLLLAALTLISGSASVKLPGANVAISISEAFTFTAVLLYGPAAGTLIVTLDGLVIAFWIARRRPEGIRALFNFTAPALSAWVSAHVFFKTSGIAPLVEQAATLNQILPSLVLFALLYFALNSWLIAFIVGFEKRRNPVEIWRHGFIWLSLNYFCGASVAVLLVGYNRTIDLRFLGIMVPLLLVLYFTFKTSMERAEDSKRHVEKLNTLYLSTIETLAMAIDAKDQITHGHIRRVQAYAVGLAQRLGISDERLIKAIEAAALLHDMGKLAVPEYILNKPGKLTAAEFEKMKLHASVGADILSAIDFPYPVVPIVRHHHENWNGTGYPAGLKATDIPIGARILSVVDCFDALTSDRPYRPRLADDEALRILLERRGSMYDPLVVDTFITVYREIKPETFLQRSAQSRYAFNEITSSSINPAPSPGAARFDEIAASADEMLQMYELAGALAGQPSVTESAEIVAKHLRRLIPCSLCVFYTYDATTDELEATDAIGDAVPVVRGLRVPLGQRLSGWVAANRQTILNSDPVLDLGEVARSAHPRLRSCLSTPVLADEHLVGVLTLYSTATTGFNENHKRIIEAIARQIAHTFRRAVDVDRSRYDDPLAGLPSLTQLERLVDSIGYPRKSTFRLLLIDVAKWQQIVSVHGRMSGIEVLKYVIHHVRSTLRVGDVLFRHGRDGLVVFVHDGEAEGADALANAMRDRVRAGLCSLSSGEPLSVDITFTHLPSPTDGRSLGEVIASIRSHRTDVSEVDNSSIH
jgi:diguanylate cyclase (GGDEF)-like protein/putative nucleotidyltransferase with HDIG domain